MPRLLMALWVAALAVVIAGELLSETSGPMRWVVERVIRRAASNRWWG